MNFEHNLQKLEALVESLQNPALGMDESLKIYAEAIELSKTCIDELRSKKGKFELLTKELERLNLDVDVEED